MVPDDFPPILFALKVDHNPLQEAIENTYLDAPCL
jgi:hypothetical protein